LQWNAHWRPLRPPDTPGFPKIKATGIEVLNDPETFELTIEGGKLTTFKVLASGEKTGLPGLYNQVGLVF
jgi:hypothetical protein